MKGIMVCAVAAALGLAGCIHSSPRNQVNNVEVREVNVYGGGLTNGVPNIAIGTATNDQMIDQGDESSGGQGNRTPISAQIPTNGSFIGALGKELVDMFGGKKGATATPAPGGAGDGGGGDCADGSCEVQ